ncbi:MAG TPA: aminotransferase class I/II-fold pyridoxal phosphate-dependent enzyme [Candidatus Deferrimicrobium sp.]|nr:aminotransferase class I/II-fold pyridoxal phosphate-dependent enzyme [Candidatus Deferrimicrobium sp.]
MSKEKKYIRGFATRAIHGSDIAKGEHMPVATPIFQTSSFDVKRVLTGTQVRPEFIYTRGGNPTTREFEQKMASLENAEMGFTFASGMGAISGTVLSLLQTGDELITDNEIYGGTWSLFSQYLGKKGIKVHFINIADETQIEDTINQKTCLLYMESPMNPTLKLVDIKRIVKIAKEHELITAIDNTFCSPYIQNPIDFGVDYVIHSCTKYIGGHGDALGGITVGSSSNIIKIMSESLDLGATLSPFNAWLFLRGLKTLEIRMERHNTNALALAKFLETQDKIERVLYPGLPSHPQHELAKKQMRGFGGIVTFILKKGTDVGGLIKNLEIPAYTVSLGDADTFIEDPFNLSHFSVPRKAKQAAGITKYMIRVSVGLETIDDLIDDFQNAFRQI